MMNGSKPVFKMGGAGDPPDTVGDPPTRTAASNVAKRPCPLARTVAPVPSGASPDGTGGSPVLSANHFSNTLSKQYDRSGDERNSGEDSTRFAQQASPFPSPPACAATGAPGRRPSPLRNWSVPTIRIAGHRDRFV